MLTPSDIRNPSRKSGYNFVTVNSAHGSGHGGGGAYRAGAGNRSDSSGGSAWRGPRRATALEAAKDYCDYINNQKPLTIGDIRNPARKSGFGYVQASTNGTGNKLYYRASVNNGGTAKLVRFIGPRRATAEEAAQDYCDYINGQRGATPATPTARKSRVVTVERAKLRFVKHPRKVRTRTGTVKTSESKPRREKEGPGYVYLMGMIGSPVDAVKIGESKDEGQYRLAGLQTGNPFELYVIGQIKADKRLALEEELHLKFAKFHHQNPKLVGEWFVKDDSIVTHFTKEATTA